MQKFLALLTAGALALGLGGCAQSAAGKTGGEPGARERLNVVSTIFAPFDFLREIAGEGIELQMLLPPGSESHSFEPTPQDIIAIQNCDLFVYVGGESDDWIEGILDSLDEASFRRVALLDLVDAVEEEVVEGMQTGAPQGPEEGSEASGHADDEVELDEHVWTSPQNAVRIVESLAETLAGMDPAGADAYRANAAAYVEELNALDAAFAGVVAAGLRTTLVFGDRFPFRYFADAYGLDYFAAFPACSTETEPSAKTVAFLIDKVNEEQIPVVFHIEFSNGRMAGTISEATGARVLELHSCHNISKDDFAAGKTYLELMWQNVENVKEALA